MNRDWIPVIIIAISALACLALAGYCLTYNNPKDFAAAQERFTNKEPQ